MLHSPIPTNSYPNLERVTRICRQHLPPHLDYEDIAVGIFVESCENGFDTPSFEFIRNRCYDHIRAHKRELRMLNDQSPPQNEPQADTDDITIDNSLVVNHLLKILSMEEKKIIIYRFINDFTPAVIARKLKLSPDRVTEILTTAIFKMREFA